MTQHTQHTHTYILAYYSYWSLWHNNLVYGQWIDHGLNIILNHKLDTWVLLTVTLIGLAQTDL